MFQEYFLESLQIYPDNLRDVLFPTIDKKACHSESTKPEILGRAFTCSCESLISSQKLSCERISDVMAAKVLGVKLMLKIT